MGDHGATVGVEGDVQDVGGAPGAVAYRGDNSGQEALLEEAKGGKPVKLGDYRRHESTHLWRFAVGDGGDSKCLPLLVNRLKMRHQHTVE